MLGFFLLLLTTFIWGTAFVAQKLGSDYIGPVTMTMLRNILGGAFLAAIVLIRNARAKSAADDAGRRSQFGFSVKAGIWCGIPLFAAMTAQQVGIKWTMPGISAFLTANYVIFVPVIHSIIKRSVPSPYVWICGVLSLAGTFFICMGGDAALSCAFHIGRGEIWTLACAVLFAIQMIAVGIFAGKCDLLVMSTSQLLTCGVLGLAVLCFTPELGEFSLQAVRKSAMAVIYCGIFSSGIAYTLQNVAQARVNASVAAIGLSFESVFGALAGWAILGDRLTSLQIAGCATVFIAVILVQVLDSRKIRS